MAGADFYVGQRVEYHSPSFNEWIQCRVAAVRADGCLKLEHADGSGVLKEAADPSKVRKVASGQASPPPVPKIGSSIPKQSPSPVPKASKPPPSQVGRSNSRPPSSQGIHSAPVAKDGASKATPRGGPGSIVSTPVRRAGSVDNVAVNRGQKHSPNGAAEKDMYPGDRVKLKQSSRQGEVLYIGPASFAGGDTVVGIKLDEKRSTSDCDGKYQGERYFRCSAGFGIYQAVDEVEVLPPETLDEELKHLIVSQPPSIDNFDLETSLDQLVGLREVKDSLKHARNFIEVQKKRSSVVQNMSFRTLHFAFLHGGQGSGTSQVARVLACMLLKLGVLASGQVVEVNRKDLVAGCSVGEVEPKLKKVLRAAEGGVLKINDADTLQDAEKQDRHGEELVAVLGRALENMGTTEEWPQRLCVVIAGKRGELKKFLGEHSSIGNAVFARFEFSDLSSLEIVSILRKLAAEQQFQLSPDLTDERLEAIVRRRMARGGGDGTRNSRLAKEMLEEALSRQTDRVWAKETVSFTGLMALVEDDFVDQVREQHEAAQSALKKLDSVVGLASVKEFVRSLYAQLQLEQQRREMGIASSGGATLHMVFVGNPGTGKTTVARVVADLFRALGLLRTGHLVEADRSSLVAGYSGQTALKTKAVVESALGGVLFVDEAYALVGEDGKDSFGREAMDTLIKLVEDYRQDLVVILAGYSMEMAKLLDTNPGLRSRFPTVIAFDDYSLEELLEIADQMLIQDVLFCPDGPPRERLRQVLKEVAMAPALGGDARASGNGRAVRNILERAKRNQAMRLQQNGKKRSQEELCTLQPEDFDGCVGGI